MARAHSNRPASTSGSKPRGGSATTGYEAELWRMAAESVAASFDVLFAHSSAVLATPCVKHGYSRPCGTRCCTN